MTQQNLTIRQAENCELKNLYALLEQLGHEKDAGYFERCLALQDKGDRRVLIAALDGEDAAYCMLNWKPKYGLFKRLDVPEIQDLNVLHAARRCGVATAMIGHCEEAARQNGYAQMGIGVGLDRSYGPAQILYTRLGYIPDGQGVSYDRRPVISGEIHPVDDQLCLMMLKNLNNTAL